MPPPPTVRKTTDNSGPGTALLTGSPAPCRASHPATYPRAPLTAIPMLVLAAQPSPPCKGFCLTNCSCPSDKALLPKPSAPSQTIHSNGQIAPQKQEQAIMHGHPANKKGITPTSSRKIMRQSQEHTSEIPAPNNHSTQINNVSYRQKRCHDWQYRRRRHYTFPVHIQWEKY